MVGERTLGSGTPIELATPLQMTFVNSFLHFFTYTHFFALILSQTCFYNHEGISVCFIFSFLAFLYKPNKCTSMSYWARGCCDGMPFLVTSFDSNL